MNADILIAISIDQEIQNVNTKCMLFCIYINLTDSSGLATRSDELTCLPRYSGWGLGSLTASRNKISAFVVTNIARPFLLRGVLVLLLVRMPSTAKDRKLHLPRISVYANNVSRL